MASTLGAIIHFPDGQRTDTVLALKHMKNIVNIIYRNVTIISESWDLQFDDDLPFLRKQYIGGKWTETPGWEEFFNRTPYMCGVYVMCEEMVRTGGLCAYFLPKSMYDRNYYGYSATGINIHIPAGLFKHVDETELKNAIKKAAIELNASYACIDRDVPSNGFNNDFFRCYSNNAYTIDPESLLPGIHWACLISPDFVKNTGTLEEIQKTIPCEIAELIEGDKGTRLWFQITADRKKVNYKKRLALRQYFNDSLYPISLKLLMKYRYGRKQEWEAFSEGFKKEQEKFFREIPLTPSEIDAIKDGSYRNMEEPTK